MNRIYANKPPDSNGYVNILEDEGYPDHLWNDSVATCYTDADEKARRIVACWNACMGISTETLERIADRSRLREAA